MELTRRRSRSAREREPVVPLINVVFLLLVFFLLTGTLRAPEPLEVTPPGADLGEPAHGEPPVVLVDADGRIAWRDELLPAPAVEALRERAARAGGGLDLVRVKADGRARARDLLPVLGALRAAGVREIELVTRPRAPDR